MHLTIPNAPCLLNVISGIPVFWVPGPFQMLARTSNFRSTKVLKKEKILFSKFIYSIGIPGFTGPIWCRLFMCFPITHDVRIPQVLNFLFYLYFPNLVCGPMLRTAVRGLHFLILLLCIDVDSLSVSHKLNFVWQYQCTVAFQIVWPSCITSKTIFVLKFWDFLRF